MATRPLQGTRVIEFTHMVMERLGLPRELGYDDAMIAALHGAGVVRDPHTP